MDEFAEDFAFGNYWVSLGNNATKPRVRITNKVTDCVCFVDTSRIPKQANNRMEWSLPVISSTQKEDWLVLGAEMLFILEYMPMDIIISEPFTGANVLVPEELLTKDVVRDLCLSTKGMFSLEHARTAAGIKNGEWYEALLKAPHIIAERQEKNLREMISPSTLKNKIRL